MRAVMLPCLVVSITLAAPARAADSDAISVLVTTLRAAEEDAGLADQVVAVIAGELTDIGLFRVMTMAEVQEMLDIEAQKQLVGCDSASCFAQLGGAMGAKLAIRGNLGRIEGGYLLTLQLINIEKARVESRFSREVRGDTSALLDNARSGIRVLMRDILSARSGKLLLRVSEEGSSIYVDDRLVGSSPAPVMEVSGGTHPVRVERDGFVAWQRDVDVRENDVTVVDVTLLPSAAFIADYEATATAYRRLGWSGIIGGASLLAGSAVLYGLAVNAAHSRDAAMEIYRRDATSLDLVTRQQRWDDANSLNQGAQTFDIVAITMLVAGAVVSGAGTYFFFSGDDPARYDQFAPASSVGSPKATAPGTAAAP